MRTFHKELLATIGPSSVHPHVIGELEAAGVTGFRINMSHTDLDGLDARISEIEQASAVPICLDLEGAQLRTGRMPERTTLSEGSRVRLIAGEGWGDAATIPITPGYAVELLEPSARMSIDFDSVLLRVDRVGPGEAHATVLTGGEVGTHRAVTAFPSPPLPPFSEKDLMAIPQAAARGVRQFALSFCEAPGPVHRLREMLHPGATIMAKIESRQGVRNLTQIAGAADALIIDRGDLSREVRLEAIPFLQKAIIRKSNVLGIPVFVATNLLESMVQRRSPTRAEVNDVMNTLLDGADGLVLAAETAIGRYPGAAAGMVATMLREYERSIEGYHIDDLLGDHPLALDRSVARRRPAGPPGPPTDPMRLRSVERRADALASGGAAT